MLLGYLARLSTIAAGALMRPKLAPLDESRIPFTVWPGDIDLYGHVNNGRYLTLMDYGRFDYVVRTGLFSMMTRRGWRPIVASATVKFRRELKPFARFEMTSRLACWDDKWIFFEQRFEKNGELHALGLVQGVLKAGKKTVAPAEVLATLGLAQKSPVPSPDMERWMASLPRTSPSKSKEPA